MSTLLEILPTGVWIGNPDCSEITGNPAAYKMMGLEPGINVSVTNPHPETPRGMRIFVDGAEVPPEDAPMQQVARTGKPWYNFEHEVLFPDGTRKIIYGSAAPLFDRQGESAEGYRGLRGFHRPQAAGGGVAAGEGGGGGGQPVQGRVPGQRQPRDPHPLRRHPRHDRTGPRHPADGDQRQCLETVKSAADSLLGLVEDLLDFERIEAGKLELAPADFLLRPMMADALRALTVRAQEKGLELVWNVEPDVPDALVGDAGRLRQVLLNLVGNAIKFTRHGEVAVRVEVADGSAPDEEAVLRFTVGDTGIGIPTDGRERIFRAFEQGGQLHHARIRRHRVGPDHRLAAGRPDGREIGVESEPGKGSTFTFTARFGRRDTPPRRGSSLGRRTRPMRRRRRPPP